MTHPGLQQSGELLQQLITSHMATGIVEDLKLIKIEITQNVVCAFPRDTAKGLGQCVLKATAVDQACESIMAFLVRYLVCHIDDF